MRHQHRGCALRLHVQPDVDGIVSGDEHRRRPMREDLVDLARRVVLLPVFVREPGILVAHFARSSKSKTISPVPPMSTRSPSWSGVVAGCAAMRWVFTYTPLVLLRSTSTCMHSTGSKSTSA